MKITDIYKYTGRNGTIFTPIDLGAAREKIKRPTSDDGKLLRKGDFSTKSAEIPREELSERTEIEEK